MRFCSQGVLCVEKRKSTLRFVSPGKMLPMEKSAEVIMEFGINDVRIHTLQKLGSFKYLASAGLVKTWKKFLYWHWHSKLLPTLVYLICVVQLKFMNKSVFSLFFLPLNAVFGSVTVE